MRCLIILLFWILGVFACTPEKSEALEEIVIDPSHNMGNYDLSSDVESEFDIFPLETTDSCLIGNIERIYYTNGLYYILDDNSIIYLFNEQGKFVSKLNKIGRAPDEYLGIRDFVVVGQNVWIYDYLSQKLNCYDSCWNKTNEILVKMVIDELVHVGNEIYGTGNWMGYEKENYQIFTYHIKDNELEKMIPYSAEDSRYFKSKMESQFALVGDSCLFTQSYCDTLFQLKNGMITPRYRYRFNERFSNKRYTDEEIAMEEKESSALILGIVGIYQTPMSVWITYAEKNVPTLAIYNKKLKETNVYSLQFINSNLGNLKTMFPTLTEKQELITYYSPGTFLNYADNIMDRKKFKNPEDLQKIEHVIKGLKEEDNPILFKYKLKPDSQL